ncbi:MAG: RHS repeat-associated core domain-containing protein [Chitinophagaceae bacterium]
MIPARKEEGLSQKKHDPFGMLLEGRNWEGGSEYRYGFNGKESENEMLGKQNSIDFGARIYNNRLGRWFNVDNLTAKYPLLSPYIFTADCPVLFIDIDGNDWFLNHTTGEVIFIKDEATLTQEVLNNLHINHIDPNKFEKLGPDNMFGEKFQVFEGMDILKDDFSEFELENKFDRALFEQYGYYYAEEVIIEEKQFISSGPFDGGERITSKAGTLKQIGIGEKQLVTKDKLNDKEILEEEVNSSKWSQISTVRYNLSKPVGQENNITAIFPENQPSNNDNSIQINLKLLKVIVEQLF